ncbi:MAG: hypothetical protein HWN81_01335 [Candidatus Lokiarchaeota archaeon]|nr:hypothetical protein [Candidatus Lokiarchaeota archaeon]
MSKIPKQPKKKKKSKEKHRSDEEFAYRSILISAILGGIFYIISIFFNIEIISMFMNINIFWTFIDISLKVIIILLFFLFITTSIGNYKELIGKPLSWKELLLLIILSIGQTILNPVVFVFTLFGLIIILIYLYVVQEI